MHPSTSQGRCQVSRRLSKLQTPPSHPFHFGFKWLLFSMQGTLPSTSPGRRQVSRRLSTLQTSVTSFSMSPLNPLSLGFASGCFSLGKVSPTDQPRPSPGGCYQLAPGKRHLARCYHFNPLSLGFFQWLPSSRQGFLPSTVKLVPGRGRTSPLGLSLGSLLVPTRTARHQEGRRRCP